MILIKKKELLSFYESCPETHSFIGENTFKINIAYNI